MTNQDEAVAAISLAVIGAIIGIMLLIAPSDKQKARCEQDHSYLIKGPADKLDVQEACFKRILRDNIKEITN